MCAHDRVQGECFSKGWTHHRRNRLWERCKWHSLKPGEESDLEHLWFHYNKAQCAFKASQGSYIRLFINGITYVQHMLVFQSWQVTDLQFPVTRNLAGFLTCVSSIRGVGWSREIWCMAAKGNLSIQTCCMCQWCSNHSAESSKCRHNKLPEWWDTNCWPGLRKLNLNQTLQTSMTHRWRHINTDIFIHQEIPGSNKH